jgi:RNase P subunit RPR2
MDAAKYAGGIIMCRAASDPRVNPDWSRADCEICGVTVVITPTGVGQLLEMSGRIHVVCNNCGNEIRQAFAQRGKPMEVIVNPDAQKYLDEMASRNDH